MGVDVSNISIKDLKQGKNEESAFQTCSGICWIELFTRSVPSFWPVKMAFLSFGFENKIKTFTTDWDFLKMPTWKLIFAGWDVRLKAIVTAHVKRQRKQMETTYQDVVQ